MVEGRNYDDLSQAGKDLATAAQQVGVYRWPRFLGDASARAVEAVANGTVPGVTKVAADTAPDVVGLIVLGLLAIMLATRQSRPSAQRSSPTTPPGPALPIITEAVLIPPPKDAETSADVLKPDGKNVGEPGTSSGVRILPGGEQEARELFDRLTKGKGGQDITPSGHVGQVVRLPDGSIIGMRPTSKSGPPTIDVKIPGLGIRELKFPGRTP